MAERTRPPRFPRGVADAAAERGFARDPAGAIVALDLSSGRVLWRTTAPMRPLVARGDALLAARRAGPHAIEFVVLDAKNGAERRASKPVAFPEWASVSLDNTPDFALEVETEEGSVYARWAARNRYRGGAAPSAKILETARRDASGEARIDIETGEVEDVSNVAETHHESLSQEPSSAANDVLEQRDVGDKSFHLVAQNTAGGAVRTVVRAVEKQTGRVAWETVVGDTAVRRPTPRRP